MATTRAERRTGRMLLRSPDVNNIPFEIDGDSARCSRVCHKGLFQDDGSVIDALAQATQLYHVVGSVVVP